VEADDLDWFRGVRPHHNDDLPTFNDEDGPVNCEAGGYGGEYEALT
jgi:hypothetical protein